MANLLVDTGFLVALYRRNDQLHQSALRFLQGNREGLITVTPVIVEAYHGSDSPAPVENRNSIGRDAAVCIDAR